MTGGRRPRGVITLARHARPFTETNASYYVHSRRRRDWPPANVDLHFQVRRQAVTDELTGLANHARFQALLRAEMEQVRRCHEPVGLITLDIDDFKSINDTYGAAKRWP